MSKGNKQKAGLVQAFMHQPALLILDEPTSGLDPLMQQEFLAMVRDARDAGQTVFMSSHVLTEVQAGRRPGGHRPRRQAGRGGAGGVARQAGRPVGGDPLRRPGRSGGVQRPARAE
ncbi:MAG TPA: AAA family ATPase [Micromonospora sp.]